MRDQKLEVGKIVIYYFSTEEEEEVGRESAPAEVVAINKDESVDLKLIDFPDREVIKGVKIWTGHVFYFTPRA